MTACLETPSDGSIPFIITIQNKLDDENYQHMKSLLTTTGRGRRTNLPQQLLTNKLLLQLELLRFECGKSWQDIEEFLPKVIEAKQLQDLNVKTEVEAAVREVHKLKGDRPDDIDSLSLFFSVNVATCISRRNVGINLLKHSIFRQNLLHPETFEELIPPDKTTNGMICDLLTFLRAEKLPLSGRSCRMTLKFLGCTVEQLDDKQLVTKLNKIATHLKSLQRSSHRDSGRAKLNLFLCDRPVELGLSLPVINTLALPPSPRNFPADADIRMATAEKKQAVLRRQLEDRERELATEKAKNTVLTSTTAELHKQNECTITCLSNSKQENRTLLADKRRMHRQLQQLRCTLREIRRSNFYKRLKRKEQHLKSMEVTIQAHVTGGCKSRLHSLKRQVKLLQTQASNHKRQIQSLRKQRDHEIARYEEAMRNILANVPGTVVKTRKDNSEEFTDQMKITIIALIAAEVSAEKCPRVIQAVAKYIFNVDLEMTSLPSERTVRRLADQGHVLAKIQVVEAVLTNSFDLHIDGTSRDKRKYVGQQVTTSEGSLSCGISLVASENAATLVETTLNLLQEISDLYSNSIEERNEHFYRILANLKGVMTDRAAVMKRYKTDLNNAIQATLGTDESIEFLYCNAHFLLGLSSKTNTTFKVVQAELGEAKIGRDLKPQFNRFSCPDSAAVRYIRMACEVLGPRGDDKNGCRDAWLAYCSMSDQQSIITSFKSNRFNNLYQAAAALHFHRRDIICFLSDFMPDKNQKLESVLCDAQSDQVAKYVLTLAIVYLRVTGPYWRLLGGKTHYLDFYIYVVEMKIQLSEWETDASTVFLEQQPSLFGKPVENNISILLRAVLDVPQALQAKVVLLFQKLCTAFIDVLKSQLSDFLEGGAYHRVNDEGLRKKLSQSQITNLVGEACFGDLDLSIYKRRNSSCHHHATVTMMIRNKMMDKWFGNKDPASQRQLLEMSAKKGPALRREHRQKEKDVIAQRKLILDSHRYRREKQKQDLIEKKNYIVQQLRQHRGPCQKADDVDRLLQNLTLQKERKEALRLEMQYHRIVLGIKSPLLRLSPSVNVLVTRLKDYLEHYLPQSDGQHLPRFNITADGGVDERQQAEPMRPADGEDDYQDMSEEPDWSQQEHEEDGIIFGNFTFEKTGQSVAVFYDDDFHIGNVSRISSPELAEVNFLKKCTIVNNTYVWPQNPDLAQVESMFVFQSDFDIVTTTGRVWSVPSNESLSSKYSVYKQRYSHS